MVCVACSHSRPAAGGYSSLSPVYSPEYASGFQILGSDSCQSSILRLSCPWQGADSIVTDLFIARGGEIPPEGFSGNVLNGNARRIVAMSSTNLAMLHAIDADSVIAGVSGRRFITNPYVLSHSEIPDVGYDGNIDFEALAASGPDLVLLYGVNGASTMEGKLRELGIPFIYIGDYLEQSPLGKAEWLVAISELLGLRETGKAKFNKIADAYNELRQSVVDNVIEAPSVMLNVPYGDSWFMPSAESYMARLIRDAGADYVYKEDTGNVSRPIDLEEAYLLASQADFWLNLDRHETVASLKANCPKFADIRCVRNGDLYNNTLRTTAGGGNDFYESAVVRPDLILHDLIAIFHPELLPPDTPLHYYRRIND